MPPFSAVRFRVTLPNKVLLSKFRPLFREWWRLHWLMASKLTALLILKFFLRWWKRPLRAISTFREIYLYRYPVDMRKYRNGLCAIVQEEMRRNVFANALFVFTNKQRKIARFIYWDNTGFAVWTKSLEKNRYKWPAGRFDGDSLSVIAKELEFLLRGMDISLHKKLEFERTFW